MPAIKCCNFALFSRITSPLTLTLQQIFLRQIATNTSLPLPSQKLYHIFIITPHLAHPLCKKSSLPPQAVAHHTPTSQPQQLLAAIHISWAQWEPCSLLVLCSSHFAPSHVELFFCKKTLSAWLRKSNLLTLQDQSHTSAKLNAPSHSFNPALCSTKHHSPLAERVVVAIQTKCIYYSIAALAYYLIFVSKFAMRTSLPTHSLSILHNERNASYIHTYRLANRLHLPPAILLFWLRHATITNALTARRA